MPLLVVWGIGPDFLPGWDKPRRTGLRPYFFFRMSFFDEGVAAGADFAGPIPKS